MWVFLWACFFVVAVLKLIAMLLFDKLEFKDDDYYEKNRLENLNNVNHCTHKGRCGEHAWVIEKCWGHEKYMFECYWCKDTWEIKN